MTKKTQRLHSFAKLPLAMAVAASMSTPASAFQFYIGDMDASLDTTLTAGVSWRMEKQDDDLIGVGNGGDGGSINFDDGDLNFKKGDTYSKIVKGTSDFMATYKDYGLFARARYWYDFALKDDDFAKDDNGFRRQLSSDGDANASGGEFLDAYLWGDFWIGDKPLNLRWGYQVVSWGESTFIFNGINVINPVDVGALRAPGSEVKEALLPVNMLYGSLGLTENLSAEAYIQLENKNSRIEDCGTFFSTVDYVSDGCGPVYAAGVFSEQDNDISGTYLTRLKDRQADDTDQFGLALRLFVPELNETEFGLYFVQYHSRFPTVGGRLASLEGITNTSPFSGIDPDEGAAYFIEYPERIQMAGLSFNTIGPFGISLGGEYSFKKDAPVQLNSTDLVLAAVGGTVSPVFQDRTSASDPSGVATLADAEAQGLLGSEQSGYDEYNISQLQFTGISFVDQIFGASRLVMVGEVGATYIHNFPDADDGGIRYGRHDMNGFGLTDLGYAACAAANSAVDPAKACNTDGYVTEFSWGYRFRGSLQYNDVFAGVNLTPILAWAHDVDGNAPGPGANFIEDRKSVGLSLRADYLNKYRATLGYTSYFGGEPYNALSDRDNLSLSVAYSF